MQDYDIEAGDRVTYKYKGESDIFTRIITINSDAEITLKDDKEILKIERIGSNGWDTVYEKEKDLLTEEERKFLNSYIKFSDYYISFISKQNHTILFYNFDDYDAIGTMDINNCYFLRLEKNKKYALSELGLYEGE